MVDRSRLDRHGPPSQRLAWAAIRVGRVPVVLGAALGFGTHDHTLIAAGSGAAGAMLMAALMVERRERRSERSAASVGGIALLAERADGSRARAE